jgi:hypothetical protein
MAKVLSLAPMLVVLLKVLTAVKEESVMPTEVASLVELIPLWFPLPLLVSLTEKNVTLAQVIMPNVVSVPPPSVSVAKEISPYPRTDRPAPRSVVMPLMSTTVKLLKSSLSDRPMCTSVLLVCQSSTLTIPVPVNHALLAATSVKKLVSARSVPQEPSGRLTNVSVVKLLTAESALAKLSAPSVHPVCMLTLRMVLAKSATCLAESVLMVPKPAALLAV